MPRRLKKTLKRQRGRAGRGGGIIGRGSSGCVFKPALKCKGEATRREGKLSKLMHQNAAEDEFQQRTLVEPLNTKQNYFVYPEDICEPELPFDPTNEVDACPNPGLTDPEFTDKRLLISADGGIPLSNLRFVKPDTMYKLFASLVNVFDGLILAHSAGVVHMDVKPDNIVLRPRGGIFKTRLIDFGLSFKIDTLSALVSIKDSTYYDYLLFMTDYPFWAPDLRLVKPDYLNALFDRDIENQKTVLQQKYPGQDIRFIIVPKNDTVLINNDYQRYYKVLSQMDLVPAKFVTDSKPVLNKDWALDISDTLFELPELERWTLVFTKNDVFGLAQSMVNIYTKCLDVIQVGYPMLEQELGSASGIEHMEALYDKMTHPDPFRRIGMKEARDIYVKEVLPPLAVILRVSPEEIEATKL